LDKHELIVAMKQLAEELGQTPTYTIFRNRVKNCQVHLERLQTRYSEIVELAGLVPATKERITSNIFKKNIDSHIDNYVPQEIKPKCIWPKIAILGDLHEPFGSDRVKSEFVSFCESFKPSYIIQMGDLMDMYSHSKFPRSHNIFTPKDEEEKAKKRIEEFWSACQKAAPEAKCIGLLGNHDARPLKRTLESMPQLEHWIEKYFKDLMTFDGVEMILDPRQEFIIEDIVFIHGYMGKLGNHRDYMLMNTVRGHDHVGGCVFRQIHGKVLWELDAGLAGDFNAKGFSYTNQRMNNWTNGFASIDELGPRFIPV
jgi:hypothetical protein